MPHPSQSLTHLEKLHPKLYLTNWVTALKIGTPRFPINGNFALIAIGGPQVVVYQQSPNCPGSYLAYAVLADSTNISEGLFFDRVGKMAACLNRALQHPQIDHVFVHCHAGINRSSSVILRWIQLFQNGRKRRKRLTQRQFSKAVAYIRHQNKRDRRLPALTNERFEQLLRGQNK